MMMVVGFTKALNSLRAVVVQWLRCWNFDQKVVSLNPGAAKLLLLDPLACILNEHLFASVSCSG